MREAAARVLDKVGTEVDTSGGAASAVATLIDVLTTELVASDFRSGCPLASVVLDAAADSEPIAEACRAGYASWRDAVAALLQRDGVAAERAGGPRDHRAGLDRGRPVARPR